MVRAANLGADISYQYALPGTNVAATLPYTTLDGDSGVPVAMDYRTAITIHWRWGKTLWQLEPYAAGSGQAPDVAGLVFGVGVRWRIVTVSVGHESRHNLDRYSNGFDGRHPPFNFNWIRLSVALGARRDWALW